MKTNGKNTNKVKTALLAVAIIFSLSAGVFVIPNARTAQATDSPDDFIGTQQAAQQLLTADVQQQGNLVFRIGAWSPVVTVESGKIAAIFADCNPGEFAVSPQYMFQEKGLMLLQSFAVALPDNTMSWLTVVYNAAGEDLLASVGVICVNDNGDNSNGSVNLDSNTRQTIQNTVNKLIVEGQPVNINHIVNVYQQITQVANNIVNITGNNNTVTQIINQSASNIVATNGTNVNQTIQQSASNVLGQNVNVTAPIVEEPTGTTTPIENTTTTAPVEEEPTTTDETPSDANTTTTSAEETSTSEEESTTPPATTTDNEEDSTTTPDDTTTTDSTTEDTTSTEDTTTTTDSDTSEDSTEEEDSTESDTSSASTSEEDSDSEGGDGDNDGE